MESGIFQFLPLLLWSLILIVPFYFILKRTGLSQWFLLLFLLSFIGFLILIWVIAFIRWPKLDHKPE